MSDTLTLDEKREKAAALIAEVKEAAAKGGGDDGPDYEAHRRKFEGAQALMPEVKAEKNESERKELLTLLDAFDKQTAEPPAGDEDEGIVTSAKSRLSELEEARSKKTESDGSYDLMFRKQRI